MRCIFCGPALGVWILSELTLSAIAAERADPFFDAEKICSNGLVNKDKLVQSLLAEYPISIEAGLKALPPEQSEPVQGTAPPVPRTPRQVLVILLGSPALCKLTCAAADNFNLVQIQIKLSNLRDGMYAPRYRLESDAPTASLLDDRAGSPNILCEPKHPATPAGKSEVPNYLTKFRVRGAPNDLSIPSSDPDGLLGGLNKASVSLANDSQLDKRSMAWEGYVGYPVLTGFQRDGSAELLAYAGGSRNTVEVNGIEDKSKTQHAVNAGLLFHITRFRGEWGHMLVARPDYLWDRADKSRIASLRAEYTPSRRGLNSFTQIMPSVFGKLIFSVPADVGKYTRRKVDATPGEQPNFGHLGVRAGGSLLSDVLPLEFTTTYTALRAWRGDIDVNYLKSDLTLHLDPKKYFGLTLGYVRGTREDTFKRDKNGNLKFTARY